MNTSQTIDHSVVIVGAGAAGAALGLCLARKGVDVALVDPRPPHPQDFRAEKLTPAQWRQVEDCGLDGVLAPIMTPEPEVWIARSGRIVDRRKSGNRNYPYPDLVSALRAGAVAQPGLRLYESRVAEIFTGPQTQTLRLSDGSTLTTRLAVIATGPGAALAGALGMKRHTIFATHSLSVGFDVAPQRRFPFPALTYYSARPDDAYAYLSLFPMRERMRANLFLYRDLGDPIVALLQRDPEQALEALIPELRDLFGPLNVGEAASLRPVDLYRMTNLRQPGIVLIGDAFGTACPASGSGLDKVFADVARLSAHAPDWLATPGMGAEKIARFYDDKLKIAADAQSLSRSRTLREMSTGEDLPWRLRRTLRAVAQTARGFFREAAPLS